MSPEQIDALREELANRANRNSNRTPPQAPSQTFGMRTHSARRTGPRQRYDPQAAAEARHADRMRLAELRKTVLAQKETEAEAKRVKVQAVKDRIAGNYPAGGYPTPAPMLLGNTDRDSTDPLMRRAYWKERGIDSPGLSTEERSRVQGPTAKVQLPVGDRPISSMYSVTPNQYQDAYGVPFTGSDPDSMRRLLALQNGTGSAMNSERSVLDQKERDAYNSRPPATESPAVVAKPGRPPAPYTGLNSISDEQMKVAGENAESEKHRKVIENAMKISGITPESIAAYDRQEKMRIEREGPRPEFTESLAPSEATEKKPRTRTYLDADGLAPYERAPLPGSILYGLDPKALGKLQERYGLPRGTTFRP